MTVTLQNKAEIELQLPVQNKRNFMLERVIKLVTIHLPKNYSMTLKAYLAVQHVTLGHT